MPKDVSPFVRKRSAPSPLKSLRRTSSTKSISRQNSTPDEKLDDSGNLPSLAPQGVAQDVKSLMRQVLVSTWTDVPEQAAGMGSERIGEVLRFRKTLPAMVSVAHLHALSTNSTQTERELAQLVARGAVRKVVVPGRGKGGAAVGEGVVLAEDWKANVRDSERLDDELKQKYLSLMDANPSSSIVPTSSLSIQDVRTFVQAGYFISTSALSGSLNDLFAAPAAAGSLSQSGFKAATGSLAAVGGTGALHESGGSGSTLATSSNSGTTFKDNVQTMTFSLPATGAYLKLLTSARLQLLALLKQISPRHKESTIGMLKEKWDGNVLHDAASKAKRARGEFAGVLPGKTRKWREFYGLEFRWVLEECVGSGLVEMFDTGSVGLAVRMP